MGDDISVCSGAVSDCLFAQIEGVAVELGIEREPP
jgi:hypothetical protein